MSAARAAGKTARILVVDEDPAGVRVLAMALRDAGFDVCETTTGRGALAAAAGAEPALLVLGWVLPDLDGPEVARRLRERGSDVPVLFLATRADVEAAVGLPPHSDCLTRPFALGEIVARVRTLLERESGVFRYADVTLDEPRHEVFRGGTPIALTATEFSLLRFFLMNPRRVLSKGQILRGVWRDDFAGTSNVVETYVSYLRRKLERYGPPLIRTVRDAGYVLDVDGRR